MGLVLFIIGLVIAIGSLGYLLYQTITLVKSPMLAIDFKKTLSKYAIFAGVFVVGLLVLLIGIPLWLNWTLIGWEWVCVILGGLFTGITMMLSLETFIIHYYGHNLPEKLDKWLFRILVVSFPLVFVFIFVLSDGYALHLTYPLINGISFTGEKPLPGTGNANITFYALCILSGAIYALLISDHYMYKQYGKHGILESTFLVAFPAGILGARLFYVIGNWNTEFGWDVMQEVTLFGKTFSIWAPLAITNGGLTILGGAITGIVVGVAWFMWRNKGYSIWVAIDIIPTILVAQAAGRWGNFFNCEVHGVLSSVEYWKWLPIVVWKNAAFSSTSGWAPDGQIFVPLFFIESFVNLFGYFVLAHVFGNKFRKYTELGDLAFGYIIWYGLTRVLMEPLRDSAYNMGENGYWSWFWSIMFIVVGSLLVLGNHLYNYFKKKKTGHYFVRDNAERNSVMQIAIVGGIALVAIIVASILMANSSFTQTISYNQFNVGLIILTCGVSLLLYLVMPIINLIEAKKVAHEQV